MFCAETVRSHHYNGAAQSQFLDAKIAIEFQPLPQVVGAHPNIVPGESQHYPEHPSGPSAIYERRPKISVVDSRSGSILAGGILRLEA